MMRSVRHGARKYLSTRPMTLQPVEMSPFVEKEIARWRDDRTSRAAEAVAACTLC